MCPALLQNIPEILVYTLCEMFRESSIGFRYVPQPWRINKVVLFQITVEHHTQRQTTPDS